MITVLLLAAFLHLPPAKIPYVEKAYELGGVPFVALVACENPRWEPWLVVNEGHGHTSAGLAMIDDEWWPQFHGDWRANLLEGWRILHAIFGDSPAKYNGGKRPNARAWRWGRRVEAERDRLSRWLWNHEEIAGGKL